MPAIDLSPTLKNETKQTYPPALSDPEIHNQQTRFTILIASTTLLIGLLCSIGIFVAKSDSMKLKELPALLLGQLIASFQLAMAVKIVLWPRLKKGESLRIPMALANLFVLLFTIPFTIAIAGCLYFIFNDNVTATDFMRLLSLPITALTELYWLPLLLLPVTLAAWKGELFLVEKMFVAMLHGKEEIPAMATTTTFALKQQTVAPRCEICHQEDLFIANTGFCRRCQRYTL